MAPFETQTRYKDERLMSDDELVYQYDSGYRGRDYRGELTRNKLGSTVAGGKSVKNYPSLV